MKLKHIIGFVCCAALFSNTIAARADVFDTFGAGARGMAMGSATCASVDDLEAVYYNPAGLGRSFGNTISLSYLYSYPLHQIQGMAFGAPTNSSTSQGMIFASLGISLNEILDRLPVQVTMGVSMGILHDLTLANLEELEESKFVYVRYGPAIQRTVIYAGLGIEVVPKWVWVGVGMHGMIKGDGSINLYLTPAQFSTQYPILPVSQDLWMKVKADINPTCGIIISPGLKNLNLAFSYKNDVSARINPVIANMQFIIGGSQSALIRAYTTVLAYYNPDMFRYGLSYKYKGFGAEVGATMEQWSGFQRSTVRSYRSTAPKFQDIVTYQGGLEYEVWVVKLRVGYQYSPSPVPTQHLYSSYLDTTRHIVSAGLSFSMQDPWGILRWPMLFEISVQDQILQEQKTTKLSLVNPAGFDSYKLSGHNITGTVAVRFKFGSTIPKDEPEQKEDIDSKLKIKEKKYRVSEF